MWLTKRDAEGYFDQLRLPRSLRPFFGRPRISLGDLRRLTDITHEEVQAAADFGVPDDDAFVLTPACATWPMGFSWSSFIAQSHLLSVCANAGLDRSRVLAADVATPAVSDASFALATDDVMLFTDGSHDHACEWAERLDLALFDGGIRRSMDKDVTAARNGTCVGIDLVDGRWWSPGANKLARLTLALAELLHVRFISRRGLQCLLGHASWLALLCRPLFSCFARVYDHGGDTPDDAVATQPAVLAEVWLFTCLMPCLEFDMARPWQTSLIATDATPSWGFGVSAAPAPASLVRAVGRFAVKRDMFVRLLRGDGDPLEQGWKARAGRPLPIPLCRSAFKTVISSRNKFPGHAGALEAEAALLGVRWILRSPARHGRRTVMLLDAKAVLGAIAKGRSSSPSLARPTRRLSAHLLAGELHLKVVYVPSEENAADDPSRGRTRPWRGRRTPLPARATRGEAAAATSERQQLRWWRQELNDIAALEEECRAHADPDLSRFLDWLGAENDFDAADASRASHFDTLQETWRALPRQLRRGSGGR